MSTSSPVHWTTQPGSLTAHPAALLIVLGYGTLWFIFRRETFDFEGVATELAQIDEEEPEDIEKVRDREKRDAEKSDRQSAV
jgi:hypothetical protein